MGCDTIGYLLVGPKKFNKKKIEKAKKVAAEIRNMAITMMEANDENFVPKTKREKELVKWIKDELSGAMPDLEAFDISTDAEVEGFLVIWGGSYRDVVTRPSPDNPKEQLLFVGGASWGDSPSESFDDMQRAFSFKIPDTLGVR